MSNAIGRAVKFREFLLRHLDDAGCSLTWNNDLSYAREIEERIKTAFAFYIDWAGGEFLEESLAKLSQEDFFHAVSKMQMPFSSVWIEMDATTPDGKHHARVGAIIDSTEEGLRVFGAMLLKPPGSKRLMVLYSGSEVLFRPNGQVELSDTPAAFLQDAIKEGGKGNVPKGANIRDVISEDTIRERETEAVQRATRCIALLLAISGFRERPEVLEIGEPETPSKRERKHFEQRGEKAPSYGLSMIRLGRLGRQEASIQREETSSNGELKRSAHWVRGHLFLARNGKLTWRKAHVRGEGKPVVKPRKVTK